MLQEQRGDRRVMMFAFIKLAPSIVTTFPAKYKFKLNPIRPSSLDFIKFWFFALYKKRGLYSACPSSILPSLPLPLILRTSISL